MLDYSKHTSIDAASILEQFCTTLFPIHHSLTFLTLTSLRHLPFLEHMLFMGSAKYPNENAYDQFLHEVRPFHLGDSFCHCTDASRSFPSTLAWRMVKRIHFRGTYGVPFRN